MRKHREQRVAQAEVEQLLEEAAATLGGTLARRWTSGVVPGWARVNELAHADWDSLVGLAYGTKPARRSAWDGAVGFLAAELVSAAGSPACLLPLQSAALIPLELDMLAGGPAPATPTELVQLVRDRIAQTRDRRRHPTTG
jgi:hypothetical protein